MDIFQIPAHFIIQYEKRMIKSHGLQENDLSLLGSFHVVGSSFPKFKFFFGHFS